MTWSDPPRTAIDAYVAEQGDDSPVIAVTLIGHLDGGYVSAGVELFEVTLADGAPRIRLVRKRTGHNEILALRALRDVPLISNAVPHLVASGDDEDGHWVVLPFYEGTQPKTVPPDVFDLLARVHVHYLGRPTRFPGL